MAFDTKTLATNDTAFEKTASKGMSEQTWRRISRALLMLGILIWWQFHFS
jgi:hypothetical protein